MSCRCIFALVVLVVVGCGKDDPQQRRVFVGEAPPSKAAVSENAKSKEKPAPPKQEAGGIKPVEIEDKRVKLVSLDLRDYGLYATIDAPRDAKVRQDLFLEINGSDGYSLTIQPDAADFAKIRRDLPNATKLIDDPDALLLQVRGGDEPRFSFYVNVKIAGKPYQVSKTEAAATAEQVRRNVEAARSLRQSVDYKKALEEHDEAESILRALGAIIVSVPDGSQIVFAPARPLHDKDLKLLAKLTELSEVYLCVNAKLTPEAFEQAVQALPRLTRLAVGGAWVNDQVVKRIGNMSKLRSLQIINAPIDDDMLKSLANLTDLTKLYLDGTRITDDGLANLQPMKKLKYLHLTGTDITDKGMAALKNFDELHELSLSDTAITDAALEKLAALPALEVLDISDTLVTDAGIEFFLKKPRMLEINLTGTNVSAAGVAKFKNAPGRKLVLPPWPIDEPDPAKVAPAPPVVKAAAITTFVEKLGGTFKRDDEADGKPIIAIDLHGKNVANADLGQLSSLTKLQSLNLEGCAAVSDAGLPYLASLTDLEELNLNGTGVKGDGFDYLKKLSKLTKLFLPAQAKFTGKQLAPLADLHNLEILTFRFPKVDYPALAVISRMAKLTQLNLDNVNLNNRKMEYLKGLKNLESLDLGREGQLSDRGLQCLKEMTGLKTLVMRNYHGSNAGLRKMAQFPSFRTSLETLEIEGPLITDSGINGLSSLDNLKRLRMEGSNLGNGALAGLPDREHLLELSAVGTRIKDDGLPPLNRLDEVEIIDLSYTEVTDAGLVNLKDLKETLAELRLVGTKIDGHGFKELDDLQRLRRLLLNGTNVDDAGAAAIARLKGLVVLDLSGTPITDAALDRLLRLPVLDELRLNDCSKLTDNAAAALKKFPKLKRVSLNGTKISSTLRQEMRKAGLKVEFLGELP